MFRRKDNTGQKIHSDDLKQFMASNQAQTMSVLIEVEAPDPVVEFTQPAKSNHARCHPSSISSSATNHQNEQSAIEQTQTLLRSLHIDHRFLRGPRVFVANATPVQLRQIMDLPTVRAVIPNHVHKISLPHS